MDAFREEIIQGIAQLRAEVQQLAQRQNLTSKQPLRKRNVTRTTTQGAGQTQAKDFETIIGRILASLQKLEEKCEAPESRNTPERVSDPPEPEPPREDAIATPTSSEDEVRQDGDTIPITDASPSTPSKFRLSAGDFGKRFTQRIDEFRNDETFTGSIRVDINGVKWEAALKRLQPPKNHDQLAIYYDNTGPFCKVLLSQSQKFVGPTLVTAAKLPSEDEAESILNAVVEDPPEGDIPYYVGLCPPFEHEPPLDAGEALKSLGQLDGITESYIHLGAAGSGTASHHEDALTESFNMVLSGVKLFVMIEEQHTDKYEDYIKAFGDCGTCDQFVRHRSAFIAPAELRKAGIDFRIHCLGPGDAVVTKPRQYHYVYNYTSCLCRSINFTRPGQPILADKTSVCPEDGLYSLDFEGKECVSPPPQVPHSVPGDAATARPRSSARAKRPAIDVEPEQSQTRPNAIANTRKKRHKTESETRECAALRTISKAFLGCDKHAKVPSWMPQSPPSESVLKTAIFVRSRLAIKQLVSLISEYRQFGLRRLPSIQELGSLNRKETFTELQRRLVEVKVFERYEELRGGMARLPSDKRKILESECCMHDMRTLQRYRNYGAQWAALAEGHDGLLCLIALKHSLPLSELLVEKQAIMDWNPSDVKQLHRLLDDGEEGNESYFKSICRVAKEVEHNLCSGQDTIFMWEGHRICPETCDEEKLLQWFRPVTFTDVNIWDPDTFSNAKRPDGWLGEEWPVDPTILSPQEKQCDFCDAVTCLCENTVEPAPQVRYYKNGRIGLRAVSENDEGVVWREGDFLGVVAGQLVPARRFEDDRWTVEFRRPDLDGEPLVCAIQTWKVGNCFRFLNQSDDPSACFRYKRRGGKFVLAVMALHDISNEQEITVSDESAGVLKLAAGLRYLH